MTRVETGSLFDGPLDWSAPWGHSAADAAESLMQTGVECEVDYWTEDVPGANIEKEFQSQVALAALDRVDRSIGRRIADYPKTTLGRLELHAERARSRGRRATLTEREWRAIVDAFGARCAYCGSKPNVLVVEHVAPLARGGHHEAWNVLPSCRHCNIEKMTRDPFQWQSGADFWEHFVPRVTEALVRLERAS